MVVQQEWNWSVTRPSSTYDANSCRNSTSIRNLGDRQAIPINRTRNTYLFLGQASDMCRMTTLMSLAWHSKCLYSCYDCPCKRHGEKSFVSLNNAVKGNIVCHILKCIQILCLQRNAVFL